LIKKDDDDDDRKETTKITFKFSEEIKGFDASDIIITGATITDLQQNQNDLTEFTAFLTSSLTSNGTISVRLRPNSFSDFFDNVGSAINSINLSYRLSENDNLTNSITGENGYARLLAADVVEHVNGAYLGELEWAGQGDIASVASSTYSASPSSDWFKVIGTSLYLNDGFHLEKDIGESHSFQVISYGPITFSNDLASWSMKGYAASEGFVNIDGVLDDGTQFNVFDKITISYEDVDEEFNVTATSFNGYTKGAKVADLSTNIETHSIALTDNTCFEIVNNALKLKDNSITEILEGLRLIADERGRGKANND